MARAKQAVIIGGGLAGLSAACYMARAGYRTILLEKNISVGGRAQFGEDAGYKFNLGPSWYVMPDIYEDFFNDFGQKPEDHYTLTRLSPAYRSFTSSSSSDALEIERMAELLDSIKPGDGLGFKRLINRSKIIYSKFKLSLLNEIWKGRRDLLKPSVISALLSMPRGSSSSRTSKLISSKEGRALVDSTSSIFGVPSNVLPAAYSFLPYSIFEQGVWYPGGGFSSVVSGFKSLAQQLGVEIYEGYQVEKVEVQYGSASAVIIKDIGQRIPADIIISASSYSTTESSLETSKQSYSSGYWSSRTYSPSSIIVSLGLNTRVPNILHHNTFTDTETDSELDIKSTTWPYKIGSFHVSCPSLTDPTLAPGGGEVLTITIPVPAGLRVEEDSENSLVSQAFARISDVIGFNINDHITTKHVVSSSYFRDMFNSPAGSAYGVALTNKQKFYKRPRAASKKLKNLFYAGQDTNPGPGAPFAVVSGKLAAYSALGKTPQAKS
ncbi:MAG: phytoene desaturase [Patescibacteria group bacterium]|nr:phytoene desaturase [Patescibacteria group bacterium]